MKAQSRLSHWVVPARLPVMLGTHNISSSIALVLFIVASGSAIAEIDPGDADPAEFPDAPQEIPTPIEEVAEIKANLIYFQRNRQRYNVEAGEFKTNLHHSTTQANIEYKSLFYAQTVGFDFAAFGAADFENSGGPDHEFSFFPWKNPWSPNWSQADARSGVSVYRAHLKLKHDQSWAKLGYFQPSGPGVLGVNWSTMPGTYLGGEAGTEVGQFSLAAAYVTQYKAPWYRTTYHFRKNDRTSEVDYLWSLGGRYAFAPGLTAELAYGEAQDYLKNAHLKIKYDKTGETGNNFYLTYQLYAMDDSDDGDSVNNNFDGVAFQHYLALNYSPSPWSLRGEFLHTYAPQSRPENVGYFAYRLMSAYGGANGAYELWWDNRSDWNHHNETAAFFKISRTLDDLIDMPGWSVGASTVRGWGGKAYGIEQTLDESAYSFDIGYTVPSGKLKQTSFNLHYTRYNNHTDLPSWTGFRNAFQDEHDVKFMIIFPYSF